MMTNISTKQHAYKTAEFSYYGCYIVY